jgi:hypothetical protein
MNFLYGDSTKSPLKSNFLEFLRDALDFSVAALKAEDHILQGIKRIQALGEETEAEVKRLEVFVAGVTQSMAQAPKGPPESPTAKCAAQLMSMADRVLHSSVDAVRAKLAADTAQVKAEEQSEREGCTHALQHLLAAHVPPDASTALHIQLRGSHYEASMLGDMELGLTWQMTMKVPEGSDWATVLRVDRMFPSFELKTPQLSGWISKEVKIRPEQLARCAVTEFADNGENISIKLRGEQNPETGYDIEIEMQSKEITISKLAPAGDASSGAFDLDADDAGKVLELAKKLRTSSKGLERDQLISATVDDAPFADRESFSDFVKDLVGMMAPITREIAERSLTPNELILRRMLGNDRREEIFVTKAALREKYEGLPAAHKKMFATLGLDPPGAKQKSEPAPPPPAAVAELPRQELAPSRPPPPRSVPPKAPSIPPLAKPTFGPSAPSEPPAAAAAEPAASEQKVEAAAPVETVVIDETAPVPPRPATQPPVAVSGAPPADAETTGNGQAVPDAPASAAGKGGAEGPAKVLAVRMKKIFALAKQGSTEEAYKEYVALFTSPGFIGHRVEDQRQALRLMVHTKTPPPKTDAVLDAYRAAKERLDALAGESKEPSDYEMLGMCQLMLGEEAARETFSTALNLERARNPTSDLVGKLMRRITTV